MKELIIKIINWFEDNILGLPSKNIIRKTTKKRNEREE
jgi:hypothetical protein